MKRIRILGVVTTGVSAAALVLAAAGTAAPDDNILGGPPLATAGSTTCSDGEFARGVSGHLGTVGPNDVVGAVHMACLNGASAGFLGGAPGSPRDSLCDPGEVAVGIEGFEGDFIDNISARCQADTLTGPIEAAGGFGGPGGVADGPYDCPAGQALVGLTGTVTDDPISMVRNVSIVCAAPADTATTLIVKTPGNRVKAKGSVEPQQNGTKVKVTLFKRKDGAFKRVDQDKPRLGPPSEFSSVFARPKAKNCKVIVEFPGDVNANPSSKSKRFKC